MKKIVAIFDGESVVTVDGLDQWDYGQKIFIQGLNLPRNVEIHFSLQEKVGEAEPRIGITKDGITEVPIPDSMLENKDSYCDYKIYSYVYITDETSGETIRKIVLKVKTRPKPIICNKPEDAELFREAIRVVNESADRAETAESGAVEAKDEAQNIADGIRADVAGMVEEANTARNTAVENANLAVNKAEETEEDKKVTETNRQATADNLAGTKQVLEETKQVEQRVIALMANDTKSYFFSTLAERDEAQGIRNCDRCSVLETRADYIYDTKNVDGDEVNPEWIKTSDWDALKTVAWEIITGKPNFAAIATTGSYRDLLDIPNRYNTPLVLDGTGEVVVWDYSLGDTAVVTLTEQKTLSITNAYNGAVAVIQVYGSTLDFSDTTLYNKSATIDYLEPLEAEHITYTLIYNAGKWDVTALVYEGGEASA